MCNKSKNIILSLFVDSSLSYTFCVFPYVLLSLNFSLQTLYLSTGEGGLSRRRESYELLLFHFCSLFYFSLLLIYSNVSIIIFLCFFFFWPTLARSCRAAMLLSPSSWPCAARPYAQWCRGSRLLRGDASSLLCRQGVDNAPRIL